MSETSYEELLGSEGPLAKQLSGFIPRSSQQIMAKSVDFALKNKKILMIEAGTGTGKTFAYLMPALLSQKKIIISTGTKNLQDQLFHRDLPLLRKSLGIPIKAALLKGRSNYLCLYRLEMNAPDNSSLHLKDYSIVQHWSDRSSDGDITSISDVAEDSSVWPLVTSTADNCLGQECPHIDDCFIVKARRRAQQADVLVINHHLFFSDFALQKDGFGELLPQSDAIIFDEAHQLHDIATQFLGMSLSSRQFNYLTRDIKNETLKNAKDMQDLLLCLDKLNMAVSQMRLAFAPESTKNSWKTVISNKSLQQAIEAIKFVFEELIANMKIASERSKELESNYRRCLELQLHFQTLTGPTPPDQIHWYETFKKAFSIHFTPLNIAPIFKKHIEENSRTYIFTSATLTVDNNFKHFSEDLGIDQFESQQLTSPFNYKQQALMYLPRYMSNPNEQNYHEILLQQTLPLIEANQGRAFFLFTSYRAMEFSAKWLSEKIKFPLLIQGDSPKTELVNRFRELGNAVLLGTSSFWEGVDVRGSALSLVIIDKLPFASPGDPILQARSHALKKQGKQPFYDYQLPRAVIDLSQGAGRLIRDIHDRGVLVIGDPRLTGRDYGKLFFKALPGMQRTRDLDRVLEFIVSLRA